MNISKGVLSFSSGCVINLDDLDDFPDYFLVITKLQQSIKNNKLSQSYMNNFLDAQLEDLQHIPEYRQLMKQLTLKYKLLFEGKKVLYQKFTKFLLKIIKNYFTSYSLQQEEAAPILEILSQQLKNHSQYFCDFWLGISKFAAYVEKHQELIKLYVSVVNEEQIFKQPGNSTFYIKSMDKILRFRAFREAFNQIRGQNKQSFIKIPYLNFKLSLYENKIYNNHTKDQFQQFLTLVPKESKSKFIHKYIKNWQQKLAILQK